MEATTSRSFAQHSNPLTSFRGRTEASTDWSYQRGKISKARLDRGPPSSESTVIRNTAHDALSKI